MKVGLQLSYIDKSIDSKFYFELFNKYLSFTPYAMCKGYKTERWNEIKFNKLLSKLGHGDSISVYDLKGNIISGKQTGSRIPFTSVTIEQDIALFFPNNIDIEKFSENINFVSAYLFHAEYVEIQSTKYIKNIQHKEFPQELYNTLKDTPYNHDAFGDVAYDLRYNPGRKDLISYSWLMAAWKMWLGNSFFDLVPKEKILSFESAFDKMKLDTGVIYVQLFEKLEESYTIENMQKQQQWRDWLGYDALIKEYT